MSGNHTVTIPRFPVIGLSTQHHDRLLAQTSLSNGSKLGGDMKPRVVGYLEEYARLLRADMDALLDRSLNDGDEGAGKEAEEIGIKIRDIKGIIRRAVEHRAVDNEDLFLNG